MRGTGLSWFGVIGFRSTGQVGCRVNHSCIQPEQKACSHAGAWKRQITFNRRENTTKLLRQKHRDLDVNFNEDLHDVNDMYR